jgi:hypothetical protein
MGTTAATSQPLTDADLADLVRLLQAIRCRGRMLAARLVDNRPLSASATVTACARAQHITLDAARALALLGRQTANHKEDQP